MNDFISRQDAIDALDGNVIVTSKESAQAVMDYIRGCADRIRSLPSVQPDLDSAYTEGYTVAESKYRKMWDEMQAAQQWIPCTSTKRPKDREEVMVTIDDGYQRYTDTDEFVNGQYWYHDDKQVVAWKPFDEPWKGEQE